MGTASRKTWLERQPDDVQEDIFAMDNRGCSLEEMQQFLKRRHGLEVPISTLHNSIKTLKEGLWHEELLAAKLATHNKKFFSENPDVDPHQVARYGLAIAGNKLDARKLDDKSLVLAMQTEAFIELRREELEVKRQTNELRRMKLEQEKKSLQLKIDQMERQRSKERKEIEKAVGTKDPQAALTEIKQIYGIA